MKIVEYDNSIATFKTENEELSSKFETVNTNYQNLSCEVEELRNYKAESEKEKKLAIISKYDKKIGEEIINNFVNQLDNYTLESLEKDLVFEMVKANPTVFSLEQKPSYVPKDAPEKGILGLLAKHAK